MDKNVRLMIFALIVLALFFLSIRYTAHVIDDFSLDYRCSDSDDGRDFFVKGEIEGNYLNDKGNFYVEKDYCENEWTLVEYYCERDGMNSYIESFRYDCDERCEKGVCVKIEEERKVVKEDSLIKLFFERLRGLI